MTRSAAFASDIETPALSRPRILNDRVRRFRRRSRSGVMTSSIMTGTKKSAMSSMPVPANRGGPMPMTVNARPFNSTTRPTIAGSAPNRRRQA